MFFDIGMGLIVATVVGLVTNSEPSWLLLAVGVVGSLWPDLDFIIWVLRGNKVDHLAHKHRDLLHRPLVLTPILTAVVWVWLGWQAGILFCIATLAHFVHDTIGHGWGIKWFWPFDNHYWCYRSFGIYPAQLHILTLYEQDVMCRDYGDPNWMKQSYGTLSWSIVSELILVIIGIVCVVTWYSTA